jgi:protein-L-isoaspartate(D-aspartate) O-methyltransferase
LWSNKNMDRLADFRSVFAEAVAARGACRNPRIKAAFARVPRHEFVEPGPWRFAEDGEPTQSADPALLYQDLALGLVPERAISTGTPSLHARSIDACAPALGERIVQIGIGMGYFTAILAELVGTSGEVEAFEVDVPLAEIARRKLAGWPQVRVHARSGITEVEPADVIYVSAGAQEIPSPWLRALRNGGRLILPLTPGDGEGGTLLVERRDRGYRARFVSRARFIPCVGATDATIANGLVEAFARGDHESVRSLRLPPEVPDGSCWFAGKGWWLSRSPVQAA